MGNKEINIVIPMAGLGSRFSIAGYQKPKPFIDVLGKAMIERVIENLYVNGAKFYLLVRKEHIESEFVTLNKLCEKFNVQIIPIDKLTEGTVCTVLYARKYINNSTPLIIANSDQIVKFDICQSINCAQDKNMDGSILTFVDHEKNPKWSFVKIDNQNRVVEVKEKIAISEFATVGIYYFGKGSNFVDSSIDMISANDRVNNEFYTCPVYNYMIRDNLEIGIFNIPQENMFGIGTPDDLNKFLKTFSSIN